MPLATQLSATPARETKIARTEGFHGMIHEIGHGLLGDQLDRGSDVHMALRQPIIRVPPRSAHQFIELPVGHAQSAAIVEIAEIEMERAVGLDVDRLILAETHRGRRPFPDTVHRENRSALKRRGIEGARSMRLMMLGKHQLVANIEARRVTRQLIAQHLPLKQLVA